MIFSTNFGLILSTKTRKIDKAEEIIKRLFFVTKFVDKNAFGVDFGLPAGSQMWPKMATQAWGQLRFFTPTTDLGDLWPLVGVIGVLRAALGTNFDQQMSKIDDKMVPKWSKIDGIMQKQDKDKHKDEDILRCTWVYTKFKSQTQIFKFTSITLKFETSFCYFELNLN